MNIGYETFVISETDCTTTGILKGFLASYVDVYRFLTLKVKSITFFFDICSLSIFLSQTQCMLFYSGICPNCGHSEKVPSNYQRIHTTNMGCETNGEGPSSSLTSRSV